VGSAHIADQYFCAQENKPSVRFITLFVMLSGDALRRKRFCWYFQRA
jgi:hypothetical protein